jgi:Ca2+-binding RTX toxin-like protein
VLHGGGGDILIGGLGNDTIHLTAGAQELRWLAGHTGFDTVNGFKP